MEDTQAEPQDKVDRRIGRWADEIPGLDLEVEALTQRVHSLHWSLDRMLSDTISRFDVNVGEYVVMMALRGAGSPYTLTPSALADACHLSSGAMTNRVDRLEEAGLVERVRGTDDRRAVHVTLTPAGHELWDRMAGQAAQRESLVASALDPGEQQQLNALLRRLVLAFEREIGPVRKKPGPS